MFCALSLIRKCRNFVQDKCVFNCNKHYCRCGVNQKAISDIYSSHYSIIVQYIDFEFIRIWLNEGKTVTKYIVHNTSTLNYYTSEIKIVFVQKLWGLRYCNISTRVPTKNFPFFPSKSKQCHYRMDVARFISQLRQVKKGQILKPSVYNSDRYCKCGVCL